MTILHTLNKSPQHADLYNHCFAALSDGDGFMLIEDGIYALASLLTLDSIKTLLQRKSLKLYYLGIDAETRGLSARLHSLPFAQATTMEDFVNLSITHQSVCSWF